MSNNISIVCPVIWCKSSFTSPKLVLQHLRHDHRKKDFQELMCKFETCFKPITSFTSYRIHLVRYHKSASSSITPLATGSDTVINTGSIEIEAVSSHDRLDYSSSAEIDESNSSDDKSNPDECDQHKLQQFKNQFFELYMQCREKHMLPSLVLHSIIDKFVQLFATFEASHPSCHCSYSNSITICDVEAMWANLQKQSYYKAFCLSAGFVEPKTIQIGQDSYQYIPILTSLQHYLSHSDVQNSIAKKQSLTTNTNTIMSCCTHGNYFKTNIYFAGKRELLRLHIYVDDLEVCNPLGSSRSIYKLTCFYFLLGNIETKFWSCLRNIHPLLIVQSSVMKKYGYDIILRPLLEDLKILEEQGLTITSSGGSETTYFGSLFSVSADNLGAHDIGGFRRCFSNGKICRFCLCSYPDIFQKDHESFFEMRNKKTHNRHIQNVLNDPRHSSETGVRTKACFSLISAYDAVMSLPSDVMHDMLEGIIPVVMKFVLEFLINQNLMTKSDFRHALQSFLFGRNDGKNKPDAWIQNTNSSLTASQSLTTFYVLPFIIERFLPQNAEVWELYLILAKICDIVLAPAISQSWISYLDGLVHDFYSLLLRLAPDKVIPKCHFLLHYPRQLLEFGPLRSMWCMRFEAYHQKIKKVVRRSHNFKNICYTIANRVQQLKCWEQYDPEHCLSEPPILIGEHMLSLTELPTDLSSKLLLIDSELHEVLSVNEVSAQSEHYKVGDIHIVDINSDMYIFCKIAYLVKIVNVWYFCGKIIPSNVCSKQLHSYSVSESDLWHLVELGQQLSIHPLDSYQYKDSTFIRLRYQIPVDDM